MLVDLQVKAGETADIINVSIKPIQSILHEKFGKRRLGCRVYSSGTKWRISQHCSDMFKSSPKEFLGHILIIDGIWIHHNTLEMKEQSKQWILLDEVAPKKAKTVPSITKIMLTFFLTFAMYHFHRLFGEGRIITRQ